MTAVAAATHTREHLHKLSASERATAANHTQHTHKYTYTWHPQMIIMTITTIMDLKRGNTLFSFTLLCCFGFDFFSLHFFLMLLLLRSTMDFAAVAVAIDPSQSVVFICRLFVVHSIHTLWHSDTLFGLFDKIKFCVLVCGI